jgi:D-sedoheptulose 7-phosphate isomerase
MKTGCSIELLILDVDGVLTDGTVICQAGGPEHKRFSFRDVDAVFEARRNGVGVALATGECTDWVNEIAGRLKIENLATGAKDKLEAVVSLSQELGVPLERVCYVGDSPRDVAALEAVGFGLAPAGSSPQARAAADRVLEAKGGHGAVEEAVGLILGFSPDTTQNADPPDGESMLTAIAEDSLALQRRTIDDLGPVILDAATAIAECLEKGGTVFTFGNGGSASDAEHLAAELIGRFEVERAGLPCIALTANQSVVTALGNDFGFDAVFERQLRALSRPGDAVVGISTSGNSPNVVAALAAGREVGCCTLGLTGGTGGRLPELADHCLIVPSDNTARIQEVHRLVIHVMCAFVERRSAGTT